MALIRVPAPRRASASHRFVPVLVLLAWTAAQASASVILNAPDPSNAFYNGYTYDYVTPSNNVPLATMFSAQLPAVDGVAGQKFWGSATLADNNGFGPYIIAKMAGTASGTLDADTYFRVNWLFDSPQLPGVYWQVVAGIQTDNGYFYGEFSNPASVNGHTASGSGLLTSNSKTFAPAGTQVQAWDMTFLIGEYGVPPINGSISVTIPQNSIDLLGAAVNGGSTAPTPGGSTVPEPGTIFLAGIGLVALGLAGRRSTGRSE
ncbi:PEP-CTERM sorting domain-containing protein [Paludibaculum fermentans]|uniref:PEP-CTERM sorting domain-containing protein n=1 Tax=Paludibaculum fermentans TaxID=1473598 RepID=UPI003EB71641